jgi:dephospho-CoA kinase
MKRINFAYFILSLLFCSCETNVRNPDTDQEGEPITFQAENGILPGIFSISDSTTIHFSQGNLQYQASTNTWRFAEHQIDIIGFDNVYITQTSSNDKWIDLFGWATSGFDNTSLDSLAINYQPWAINNEYKSNCHDNPFGYGFSLFFLDTIISDTLDIEIDFSIDSTNYDWGIYNAITNGGGQDSVWRTLTAEEWNYLIFKRNNAENLYGIATIEGVNGVILLPDDWITPQGIIFRSGLGDAFGEEYIREGAVDRKKLGTLVFSDPNALKKLNETVSPFIMRAVTERILEAKADGVSTVLDAPLLFEYGLERHCDAVIGVTVDMETAVRRLLDRDHRSETELRARLAYQHDGAFFREHCDHVLENNADEQALAAALEDILEKIYIYR